MATFEHREWKQGAKRLNNMVAELVSVAPAARSISACEFSNPRDGWVFFSSTASVKGDGRAWLALGDAAEDEAIILHGPGDGKTLEAMRKLPFGEYTLNLHCQSDAAVQELVVRTIPEICYPGVGYRPNPWMSSYPRYDWDYLEGIDMTRNVNVILERNPDPTMDVELWRKQGRKVLTRGTTHAVNAIPNPVTAEKILQCWTSFDGFRRPDRDGILFDELDSGSHEDTYPAYIEAVKMLAADPAFSDKVLQPYCVHLYNGDLSSIFTREVIKAGYKIAEERYIPTPPSEDEARSILKYYLVETIRRYQQLVPDFQKHLIFALGYMTAPPEWLNTHPGVDWKVFEDMQYNVLANAPSLWGLYGVQCYHSAYADEEVQRWTAKLFRHYCIEGRRDMLSDDPYLLPHVQNGDFDDGTTGWNLAPAEESSLSVKSAEKYSWLQGRYPHTEQGETFLWTRRSARAPNVFSQPIKALKPGRLYSLKMFTADYQELVKQKSVKAEHHLRIQIDGADLIDDKCFHELYPSGMAGHGYETFDRKNNLWITYHRLVFRATDAVGKLTVSDWSSEAEPGGRIGQELIHNYVQVQPYLED